MLEIRRSSPAATIFIIAIIAVIFLLCNPCTQVVESRSLSVFGVSKDNLPNPGVPTHYFDYEDYPDIQLPFQGPRLRRWAFPVDVQNNKCPPGQKPHSSGYGCVLDADGDYD